MDGIINVNIKLFIEVALLATEKENFLLNNLPQFFDRQVHADKFRDFFIFDQVFYKITHRIERQVKEVFSEVEGQVKAIWVDPQAVVIVFVLFE